MKRIAIIGAGMTGLSAAHFLSEQGLDVQVFDKGRALGGRVATRRTPVGLFDHGAPQIDVQGPRFDEFLSILSVSSHSTGVRFGSPGMRSVFDQFAGDPRIRQGVRIAGIRLESDGWILRESSSGHLGILITCFSRSPHLRPMISFKAWTMILPSQAGG